MAATTALVLDHDQVRRKLERIAHQLRGKFRLNDDGSKLLLDTKVSQNLFLKLLNDDFLQSELTKRYYASLAKDNLEASVEVPAEG